MKKSARPIPAAEIPERVRALVALEFCLNVSQCTDDKSFEALGADSLDKIEVIMETELKFGIEVPDVDAEKILTVGDLAAYVVKEHPRQFNR